MRKWILWCLIMGVAVVGLNATQPFWSMEPSTRQIELADSLTGFDITKYVINIAIDDINPYIQGWVEASIMAEEYLPFIEYRLTGGTLAVTEVRVNDAVSTFTHEDGIIRIPVDVSAGTQFHTKVYYSGVPGLSPPPYNIGLRFTPVGVYTLSNPDAGRYWWPSYDHPWDKALVDWHIRVRENWLAAANGLRTGITDNGDGTRTHHWVSSSPIATYVVGFAAGPYTEFHQQAGDLPIQNFVLPSQLNNAMADFGNVPEMIQCFSGLFGAYPFEKYGHVVVNMATYAAMEHQTMTTFGARYLDGQQTYESIVAHELAHQWYGNLVTPLTMKEVWLKESFATYSEALWVHHKSGWQAACNYIRSDIQQYYVNWENSNGPHTIFNPAYNLMFAPPTYEKSASVLHMLRLKMGNDAFFQFIRELVIRYYNSNLITAEFIALAEEISGQNLTQFFRQWIYSPGIPNARLAVFHNGQNRAKVIGKSTSPTATLFDLDIPLSIPGSVVADSVVVRATPEGFVTYFDYAPGDDIATLVVDPNNWVLARQLSLEQMRLLSCLPLDGAVVLTWEPYGGGIAVQGYHIFRRSPLGIWQRITANPVSGTVFTDHSVLNGVQYEYHITAVDEEGYISLPSNTLNAIPIRFAFDLGLLVVDETRDGTGAAFSPDDPMVDEFYHRVLDGITFAVWDHASQGSPPLSILARYQVVLWHADDFTDIQLLPNLEALGSYLLSGGRLIISGWKHPSAFDVAFLNRFMPGIEPVYNNSAALISVRSDRYPALNPDPAKLAAPWNGMLPMTYTFAGAQDVLFTAQILNEGIGHNNPAVIRIETDGGLLVLTGFPLYFMQEDEVRMFLNDMVSELLTLPQSEPVGKVSLTAYPNPFRSGLGMTIRTENAGIRSVEIYDLKGRRVLKISGREAYGSGNVRQVHLDPSRLERFASGIYLIRVTTMHGHYTRKVMLVK